VAATERADVVVAGAGMAGLCASVAALEAGARVITLEKGSRAGGSMLLSGGLIWTFSDQARLRREIAEGDAALQDLVVERLDESLAWLARQGVALGKQQDFMWYGLGRAAAPPAMTEALVRRLTALGGEIRLRTPLAELAGDGGEIRALRAMTGQGPVELEAGAFVLATGGFQGNAELLARHVTPHADELYLRANPWSSGDGLLAATAAGAAVTPWLDPFYGHALAAPPTRFGPDEFLHVTQRYGPLSVALNTAGRRFADESAGTGEESLNQAVARQPSATAVYVVDAAIAEMSYFGAEPARQTIARARERGGPVAQAGRLEELCELLGRWGLPAPTALESLRAYNAALTSGSAAALRPARRKNRFPLREPPFFAVQVRPGITFTGGGLATDTTMRVRRRPPAPGHVGRLYAAGCDVGGISGRGYLGGLATALVTGRAAGRAAVSGQGAHQPV
jgi:succinate dehydrogenase/fumarate reductase flavoprotein subunit